MAHHDIESTTGEMGVLPDIVEEDGESSDIDSSQTSHGDNSDCVQDVTHDCLVRG